MKKTQITIIGLGGVGGYFGYKLADSYQNETAVRINFVARGITYGVVKENGLTLISPEHEGAAPVRPYQLYENITDVIDQDVLVLCTKEYDLENLCLQLKDKIKANTVMIPLMNGVDIYDRIRNIITDGIILPSCVYVASHIKEKGTVAHKGMAGRIIIGKDPSRQDYHPEPVIDLFKQAGIQIIYKEDPFPEIWTKFFFIASFGLVSARYNRSIGKINEQPGMHRLATQIMEEIKMIADLEGIAISPYIIEQTFERAKSFPYDTPTSLQLDVQLEKDQNELDLFAGAIINYAVKWNIKVPHSLRIYEDILTGKII